MNKKNEDCISRKEAISWIENLRTLNEHYHPNAKDNYLIDCDSAIDHLKQVPSVLPKADKPSGKWIRHYAKFGEGGDHRECSNCKTWFIWDMPRNSFCPNCGAKMESEG